MSVGLLIITHERIAAAIVDTAVGMLGTSPLPIHVLPVPRDCDPDALSAEARRRIAEVDTGDGVLVITDIYGSTPSNVACGLADGEHVQVVSGINLPMLVRVLNYPQLGLAALADKAVSGGRDGVFSCPGRDAD